MFCKRNGKERNAMERNPSSWNDCFNPLQLFWPMRARRLALGCLVISLQINQCLTDINITLILIFPQVGDVWDVQSSMIKESRIASLCLATEAWTPGRSVRRWPTHSGLCLTAHSVSHPSMALTLSSTVYDDYLDLLSYGVLSSLSESSSSSS